MTEYIKRDITDTVIEAINEMPIVVITGMRQTGKSTFLQMQDSLKERRYITFDDFAYLEAAKENPEGIVDADVPVTIDEVQKCPEIFAAIKRSVDKKRRTGRFLLSGSANFSLIKGISETLAGRAVYFTLHPFTLRELQRKTSEKPFLQRFFETGQIQQPRLKTAIKSEDILLGGMPPIHLKETKNKALWFKGYEQTYLERDVRVLSQIGNIISFRHLLQLTALRTGQILSISQLSRDAKLTMATTSRYLSLLEASFIIHRLSPYLKNRASRLIKSPKIYLSDSGLACYLSGIKSLEAEPLKGAMLETYVCNNLIGIIDSRWLDAELYFWHIQGRYEVDFIIESGNRCLAIEIKFGTRWEERDLSGLKAFISSTPSCMAAILAYNGYEIVRLGDKIWAMPLGVVLS